MAKKITPTHDEGHEITEKKLAELERRLAAEYRVAQAEIAEKLNDYMMRFETKDLRKKDQVARGVITEAEYQQWRKGQLIVGQRWEDLRHDVAVRFHETNGAAKALSAESAAAIYAENMNFGAYIVEKTARIETGFVLANEKSIVRLVRDDPKLFPAPGRKLRRRVAEGKDVLWNRRQVQSLALQAIIQGESIPKIASRIVTELGEKNYRSAVRTARTMITGAQNGGRLDAFRELSAEGVKMKKMWIATLDMRTRHSHAALDGAMVDVDEPFNNGLMNPGDAGGDPAEVYNCRCTMIAKINGIGRDLSGRDAKKLDGLSYDEWKAGKYKQQAKDIEGQTEAGILARYAYIAEYRR